MIDVVQLGRCMPTLPEGQVAALHPHLAAALEGAHVEPGRELAMLLAQLGHESVDLRRWEESLLYTTAERISAIWPSRFPSPADAAPFVRNPAALANVVYGGRMANGLPPSGDGWHFRGRGPMQLTGRANYRSAGRAIGVDLEQHPERAAEPATAFRVALWYWVAKGCPAPARAGDVAAVTKLINGGLVGLDDRTDRYERACRVLGVTP